MGEQPANSMSTGVKVLIAAVAIAAVAIAIDYYVLQGQDDDDRPPVIVRNGSAIFQGGDPAVPSKWKDWSKDILGNQWKPDHPKGKPVERFDVTFVNVPAPSTCATPVLQGTEVQLEYLSATGAEPTKMSVYIKRKFSFPDFGKREPKVDSGSVSLTPRQS